MKFQSSLAPYFQDGRHGKGAEIKVSPISMKIGTKGKSDVLILLVISVFLSDPLSSRWRPWKRAEIKVSPISMKIGTKGRSGVLILMVLSFFLSDPLFQDGRHEKGPKLKFLRFQ